MHQSMELSYSFKAVKTELGVVQKEIVSIQRLACLSVTGAITSTSTVALEVLRPAPGSMHKTGSQINSTETVQK